MPLTTGGSSRALTNGLISSTVYVSLHSASPGTTGANELTNYGRISITSSQWTTNNGVATLNATRNFTTLASATARPTHMAIRSSNTGAGTIYYQDTVEGASGSGNLASGTIVRFQANSLTIQFT